ncbi:MAG: molybdopterin-dependent oxidoreductase [Candidatus Binataceae bacterium]
MIVLAPPARGGQSPTSADASLHITGRVGHPLTLYLADLEQLPQKITAVNDEKGAAVTYEGVAVAELLRQAGAPLGPQLRGPQMRLYVVVKASDGYQPVFALPEFDPAFTDRVIILAYRRDGHAMALPEGPLRLIVPGEKRHARWVREVTALEVEAAQ